MSQPNSVHHSDILDTILRLQFQYERDHGAKPTTCFVNFGPNRPANVRLYGMEIRLSDLHGITLATIRD
jgi:hypothetical protein